MTSNSKLQATLAQHSYAWTRSSITDGGVATHANGYKIAYDLSSDLWMHYRGKSDKSTEGRGLLTLVAHLAKVSALAEHDRGTLNMMRTMISRRPR